MGTKTRIAIGNPCDPEGANKPRGHVSRSSAIRDLRIRGFSRDEARDFLTKAAACPGTSVACDNREGQLIEMCVFEVIEDELV